MAKRKFKKGERVEAKGCVGSAEIVSFIKGFGVYLLDSPLSAKFVAKDIGVVLYVPFWTFEESQLASKEFDV